ncbi:MAG TPA: hypothetical protein VL752_15195 [Acidisoma sp.]|uniref:hypothetical protein n=1 Tax=Acidisoma sp. TaxID=1872115 RepID=UPI002CCF3282|nr:hypothetical protein [Acidisoma sp.]HTI02295.1 hypothetical protein [Acidisoma sp.]
MTRPFVKRHPETCGPTPQRRRLGLLALLPALALLAGCAGNNGAQNAAAGKIPDGTIVMHQVQAAFIGSGNGGDGTLTYQGRTYPFVIGGLGVGGIGASTIDATGEVYNLKSVAQFPGSYVQGRMGYAFGTESHGDLWLKNDAGVVLHLAAKRTGLMLSLGGDVILIQMK